jgi:FAD/FMN-containing dehydrogenase
MATCRANAVFTIDNLHEADVVLADGSFVTASRRRTPTSHGRCEEAGNLGVVTSFLFQLIL